MKLYEYVVRRLILLVFVLLAVSLVVFVITRAFLPATYAVAPYITPRMSNLQKLLAAQSLGVATPSCPSWQALVANRPGCVVPLYDQYFAWLSNVLFRGNWGLSQIPGVAVGTSTWYLFTSRFPLTVELALVASVLTLIIALPLGIVSAVHNNKPPDHASRIIALTGYSVPIYWLGWMLQLALIIYLAVTVTTSTGAVIKLGWFPVSGTVASGASCLLCLPASAHVVTYTGIPIIDGLLSGNLAYAWDALVAVFLPSITLAIATIGALTRIVRSSMMEALRQDYILLARSKGVSERRVIYRHALKNALLPALTVTGLIFAGLLGGAVITENVFSWPGVGSLSLSAALYLDINFLELYTLIVALILVLANLTVDVLYAIIDPRIRY